MELGFFIVLGGLFLIFLFAASFVASFRKISPEDLGKTYLRLGLRDLKARIEEELRFVEGRESELKARLRHLEGLEQAVSEGVKESLNHCALLRGDLKDAG